MCAEVWCQDRVVPGPREQRRSHFCPEICVESSIESKAKWAADYLNLDYEYRFTGYGDLTGELLRAR